MSCQYGEEELPSVCIRSLLYSTYSRLRCRQKILCIPLSHVPQVNEYVCDGHFTLTRQDKEVWLVFRRQKSFFYFFRIAVYIDFRVVSGHVLEFYLVCAVGCVYDARRHVFFYLRGSRIHSCGISYVFPHVAYARPIIEYLLCVDNVKAPKFHFDSVHFSEMINVSIDCA